MSTIRRLPKKASYDGPKGNRQFKVYCGGGHNSDIVIEKNETIVHSTIKSNIEFNLNIASGDKITIRANSRKTGPKDTAPFTTLINPDTSDEKPYPYDDEFLDALKITYTLDIEVR